MAKRAPRLQFTDEELSAPEVRKAAQKADRCADKLEKREAKIPKKAVKTEARVIDPDTGKVTTRVFVSEAEKKRPPSKLTHAVSDAPGAVLSSAAHREIRSAEDDNVGVESAHKLEEAAEGSIRFCIHPRLQVSLKGDTVGGGSIVQLIPLPRQAVVSPYPAKVLAIMAGYGRHYKLIVDEGSILNARLKQATVRPGEH